MVEYKEEGNIIMLILYVIYVIFMILLEKEYIQKIYFFQKNFINILYWVNIKKKHVKIDL